MNGDVLQSLIWKCRLLILGIGRTGHFPIYVEHLTTCKRANEQYVQNKMDNLEKQLSQKEKQLSQKDSLIEQLQAEIKELKNN